MLSQVDVPPSVKFRAIFGVANARGAVLLKTNPALFGLLERIRAPAVAFPPPNVNRRFSGHRSTTNIGQACKLAVQGTAVENQASGVGGIARPLTTTNTAILTNVAKEIHADSTRSGAVVGSDCCWTSITARAAGQIQMFRFHPTWSTRVGHHHPRSFPKTYRLR